jgi:hypothetical protein
VQFLPVLLIPLLLLLYPRRGSGGLWLALALYVLAKLLETIRRASVRSAGGRISGHSLKHVAAAAGMARSGLACAPAGPVAFSPRRPFPARVGRRPEPFRSLHVPPCRCRRARRRLAHRLQQGAARAPRTSGAAGRSAEAPLAPPQAAPADAKAGSALSITSADLGTDLGSRRPRRHRQGAFAPTDTIIVAITTTNAGSAPVNAQGHRALVRCAEAPCSTRKAGSRISAARRR